MDTSTRASGSTWLSGWGCSLLGEVEVVGSEMSGFEVIDEDSIVTTVDVDFKVFNGPFDDLVWSIIWWFMNSIMPDENIGSSR